jgi:hypothetical protein
MKQLGLHGGLLVFPFMLQPPLSTGSAIPKVTRPCKDPVNGKTGPLMRVWRKGKRRLGKLLRLANRVRHHSPARAEGFFALDRRVASSLVLNL